MTYDDAVQYIKNHAASVTSLSRCFNIFEELIVEALRTGRMDYGEFARFAVSQTAKVTETPKRLYWINEPGMDEVVCPFCENGAQTKTTLVPFLSGGEVFTLAIPEQSMKQIKKLSAHVAEWRRIQLNQSKKARQFRLNRARIRATF